MKIAYVDTSFLVAMAFDEPKGKRSAGRLKTFEHRLSANLLEAEFRSALAREGVASHGAHFLSWLTWVYPNRPLAKEFNTVLALGQVEGADLWHLACALFVAPNPRELSFLTHDASQKKLAREVGFTV